MPLYCLGDILLSPADITRVVFRETFTGDGIDTTFQLTSGIGNGTFASGSWASAAILNTFPSDVTNDSGDPIYDSTVLFVRNRISVTSISAGGLVTLSHAPRSGVDFYVWYWYNLQPGDNLDDYYREDYVASMEAGATINLVDLDDTNITSEPADNDVLAYNTTTDTWEAVSLSSLGVDTAMTATAQSTNYNAANRDFVLMTTGATNKTVTLPAAASNTDAIIEVKKVDSGAGNVIIDGNLAETIDGALTQTILSQYTNLVLHCDGSNWYIK